MTERIIIMNLSNQISYSVVATIVTNRRVIIQYGGAFVFADFVSSEGWQLSDAAPSESDKAALANVIRAHGGFDNTTVDVEPPGPPEAA